MRTDTRDMLSVTEAGRSLGRLTSDVANGRTVVVLKNNEPTAALVSVRTMERLDRVEELEEDLRMLAIAYTRTLTDSGVRHTLDDVAAEFDIDLVDQD
ncbi:MULTISPECIES: type II toxin-antitoxin system Phd/YefM family antitoxin [Isoptericola]|uniref:type II toxin-antitoxin system Phd/YefM family antitoxin n=1 Tax=Isoptericola TaxID=254250 RepID=UPI00383B9625